MLTPFSNQAGLPVRETANARDERDAEPALLILWTRHKTAITMASQLQGASLYARPCFNPQRHITESLRLEHCRKLSQQVWNCRFPFARLTQKKFLWSLAFWSPAVWPMQRFWLYFGSNLNATTTYAVPVSVSEVDSLWWQPEIKATFYVDANWNRTFLFMFNSIHTSEPKCFLVGGNVQTFKPVFWCGKMGKFFLSLSLSLCLSVCLSFPPIYTWSKIKTSLCVCVCVV